MLQRRIPVTKNGQPVDYRREAGETMLYRFGRFLQLFGLILVPVGVSGNLARPEEVTVKTSLTIASIGMAVFFLGWLLQQKTRPGP